MKQKSNKQIKKWQTFIIIIFLLLLLLFFLPAQCYQFSFIFMFCILVEKQFVEKHFVTLFLILLYK